MDFKLITNGLEHCWNKKTKKKNDTLANLSISAGDILGFQDRKINVIY